MVYLLRFSVCAGAYYILAVFRKSSYEADHTVSAQMEPASVRKELIQVTFHSRLSIQDCNSSLEPLCPDHLGIPSGISMILRMGAGKCMCPLTCIAYLTVDCRIYGQ